MNRNERNEGLAATKKLALFCVQQKGWRTSLGIHEPKRIRYLFQVQGKDAEDGKENITYIYTEEK